MVSYNINQEQATVVIRGEMFNIESDNPNYKPLVRALIDGKSDEEILELLKAPSPLKSITADMIDLNGLSQALCNRVKELQNNGQPLDSIQKFIENVKLNPSAESVKDLYGFLTACDLPIVEDGCFLAYKRVDENFKDVRTHTFDNSVGKVVKMPREAVNPDREVTCSFGLHVCSKSYLSSYSGKNIIVCKVNPKDVVSVPVDYEQSKMRVCEYEVIDVLESDEEIRPYAASTKETSKPSKRKSKRVKSVIQDLNKGEKFDAYVKHRNLQEDITSMTANQKYALRRMAARLLYEKTTAPGAAINACKTLTELKKCCCG